MAAHLTPAEAWHAVSVAARAAIGVAPTALMPGDPAEVLALRGSSLTDAIARASDERIVVHRGRVVATTTVSTVLRPSRPDPGAPPVSPAPGARTPTPTALA
jgi:cytosine deaminase